MCPSLYFHSELEAGKQAVAFMSVTTRLSQTREENKYSTSACYVLGWETEKHGNKELGPRAQANLGQRSVPLLTSCAFIDKLILWVSVSPSITCK